MKWIGKRIITFLITAFLVSLIAFFVFQIIPGDAVVTKLGTNATPEKIEALREEYGLNDPAWERYFRWLGGIVQGDFGMSYTYDMPVWNLVSEKLVVTTWLALESFLLIVGLSIPLGVVLARYAKTPVGVAGNVLTQIIMAIPPFFTGIMLILLFGLLLKWFVPYRFVYPTDDFGGFLGCLLPGAFAIAIPKIAMVVRFLRTNVLEEEKKDYVRTAYSKGAAENRVFFRHILKNALIPTVTILGMQLAEILAGSVVVEQVFGLPGLGRLLVSSINNRDYPVVQFILLYVALVVMLSNTLVDILYGVIDPRISPEDAE